MDNVEIVEHWDISKLNLQDIAGQGVTLGIEVVFFSVMTGWVIGKMIRLMMGKSS